MRNQTVLFSLLSFMLCSCSQFNASNGNMTMGANSYPKATKTQSPTRTANYSERLPQHIASQEKTIVVDPNVHAWGAYANGSLVRAGLATSGGSWCGDVKRPCRTKAGSFRIASLGGAGCKSTLFPLGKGGAPMPYCMFFNKNQGLHGSPYVMEGNVSHGCVRMQVSDAEWVRYNFANIGTKVIVRPY